jgi:outer membrane protein assembly factor BamB
MMAGLILLSTINSTFVSPTTASPSNIHFKPVSSFQKFAQTEPYTHSAVIKAQTSVRPQDNTVSPDPPSDDWPTYHRDMLRSGYDPAISQFTSVSLNWKSTTLDGDVYAEPLIVGMDVIVATEDNSIYELNAATGQTMWHINLGTPVNGAVLPCGDINPSGITGTPVIDTSGRTIFVVAFLQSPQLHHELFAVDLDTGNVKFQVAIDPPGANATVEQQRAALALANGYVYVAYGGLAGDCGQYHGWVAATSTNGVGTVLGYQVPTGNAGAIWGGGDGPVVDQTGDLLVATGNSFSTSTFDYGNAVLKLSPATSPSISLVDYFAPSNWATLNSQDLDLGSTEPVILNSNYLFQIGKDGIGYLLNANNLGGIGGQVYSSQVCTSSHGAYGGLAYSPPYLIVPCNDGVVALNINLGSNPPFTVAWRGPNFLAGPPIIAGNAVWDVDVSDGRIYALNLTSGQTLYDDAIGTLPTHFSSLSEGDGQIFVTASQQVLAFLPLPQITFFTNPPSAGSISWDSCSIPGYTNGQTLLSSNFGDHVICYVPSGYTISSWTCTGGLACSGSNDPTSVSVTGSGSVTLSLKMGSLSNPISTMLTASASQPRPGTGASFMVFGTLMAQGAGLNGEPIVCVLSWSATVVPATTQPRGSYTCNVTAPNTPGPYNVDVFFLGDYSSPQDLPSKATAMITVT